MNATASLEQNTDKWHIWRHNGIGSSDVPILLGVSKYSTIDKLLAEKILPEPPAQKTNYVMELGQRLEPKARAIFQLKTGLDFQPKLFVMEQYPFMRSSLDGIVDRTLLELKYTGKYKPMPDSHYAQIQHQLLISNGELCNWLSYDYDKQADEVILHKEIRVKPDKVYQQKILTACISFWDTVLKLRGKS